MIHEVKINLSTSNEKGAVYPIVLVLIPVLLMFSGLIIDVGMGVYQHTKLTGAVDAAAVGSLDAYDRNEWEENENIVIDYGDALQLATIYLTKNMPDATLKSIRVEEDKVYVEAKATAQLFFMNIFGKSDMDISASARASLQDGS